MTGEKTSVHKPLLSAGDVTHKGHALWLDGNVGFTIQKDSPILTAMRMFFEKACEQHSWIEAIDLTKERGVYNLYVQVAGGEGNVERAVDVSPNEMEVEVEKSCIGGPSAGEPVRPREMGVPSTSACLRSRHKQGKMSTMPQAMQPIVRGVSIVSEVVDVCHHT